jgi:3-hydroxyisobutyrate dehydrogenase/glyoxylate/succinic semialdehyde reductase
MNVGFIGLGIMGSRMAGNLLKNNYKLYIHNRTEEKAESLIQNGSVFCKTAAELGSSCDVVFTMLSEPEIVKKIVFGDTGLLSSMKPGSLWIDSTTVNPGFTQMESEEAKKNKIRFIDAPVAGTKMPAEKGELVFLAGGDEADIEEIMPLLNCMGKRTVYAGKCGNGAAMKMAVNTVLGLSMAGYVEAVSLGEALGLNKELLVDTLNSLPVTSTFLQLKKNKIMNEDFEPEFPLQWMHKDLFLAAEEAYKNNLPVPVINAAKELYAAAKKYGYAEKDLSSVYEVLKGKMAE